ncbi:MAG TPA: uroporphyrinogen decarboxylase family protein [Desulfobacterales bacterium]|nr:uroporphyrinogen decarboxylase family protein [Desulfobacterales bacterium]
MQPAAVPDLEQLTDLWNRRLAERERGILDFYAGRRRWMVIQRPAYHIYGECNSVPDIVTNNLRQMQAWLACPWTDELPHLEPWIGTGVYANAFGCPYLWRQGEAPDVRSRYRSIEEVRGIAKPDWRSSPVMGMVLEAIDALLEATRGRLPISSTDPQSPYDSATLALDTSEFFTACYTEPETVASFVGIITELLIEFTRVQWERIGDGRVARPGHSIPSHTTLTGINLSDDNLAVASPLINERVSLPADRRLSEEFGGLFLHSCGVWHHTMRAAVAHGATGICCAVQRATDPTPDDPAKIRAALAGTDVMVRARFGQDTEHLLTDLPKIAGPGLRIIVDILREEPDDAAWARIAETNYRRASELLARLYGA